MKIKDVVKRTIASNIRRARTDANMTQADAAEKLGITAQAISNYERGINGIENSMLVRMCEVYNTSMGNIIGEDDENAPGEISLTEGEKELIELFRLIPEDQQKVFLGMVRSYANSLKAE